jgi:hypothetical protein
MSRVELTPGGGGEGEIYKSYDNEKAQSSIIINYQLSAVNTKREKIDGP